MTIIRLKNEKKVWEELLKAPGELKAQTYSDMPHGCINFTSLDRIWPRLNRVDIMLEREELILRGMTEQKELMNVKLRSLTGRDYKVVKLKEVDNLNYIQISQRLNMSDRTARRIIAKVKKDWKESKKI